MNITFAMSQFAPVALGFFGLGTGYLIWGPQELLGFVPRSAAVDRANGVWGLFLPGLCQLVTGVYLFVGLAWFHSLRDPALYTAALAFSAYGIHWFALGWNRFQGNDNRPTGLMSIPFVVISVLGMVVFFDVGGWPVGVLFLGLTLVYLSEFFASFSLGVRYAATEGSHEKPAIRSNPAERALGLAHTLTGVWLMYLMFATTLNISLGFDLPGA